MAELKHFVTRNKHETTRSKWKNTVIEQCIENFRNIAIRVYCVCVCVFFWGYTNYQLECYFHRKCHENVKIVPNLVADMQRAHSSGNCERNTCDTPFQSVCNSNNYFWCSIVALVRRKPMQNEQNEQKTTTTPLKTINNTDTLENHRDITIDHSKNKFCGAQSRIRFLITQAHIHEHIKRALGYNSMCICPIIMPEMRTGRKLLISFFILPCCCVYSFSFAWSRAHFIWIQHRPSSIYITQKHIHFDEFQHFCCN